ncbi:Ig-like domain repeat protein [Nocardioides aurantiacus]|uniref:Ig-like domain-containing protein n=1 Tax=Nocardioides aurantiacus TaxID=86796 RepID=A0A3N2CSC5_9ACTN|nr:Ig-like domain repeat protein [Nocardioides aurantiacus]ROR90441.1 Ig-like domain-containing protein [Nocardioides aurantiacus]
MRSSSIRGPRRLLTVLLVGILAASGWGLAPTSASAAVAAPYGLSPAGTTVQQIPVLSWTRVEGASSYDVQVSTSSDLSSPLVNTSTTNAAYVPTTQLPGDTDIFWQVRARFSTTSTSDWVQASFRRGALDRPVPVGPSDGTDLQPPVDPATFTWSAVPGATGYDVQVGTDPQFTDPALYATRSVRSTSLTDTTQQAPGTYYWRVRAQMAPGTVTPWSSEAPGNPWSYRVLPLPAVSLASPPHDPGGLSPITEVALDWDPVPGAATYDLQLSTDENFQNDTAAVTRTVTRITGTRYSPPSTLDNDEYYWRVRPVDLAGNAPSWGSDQAVWQFRRNWPDQPELVHPVDGSTLGDPLFLEWEPVELAGYYQVQISTQRSFPDDNKLTTRCTTTQTTFTPASARERACMPSAGGQFYWRVLAFDRTPTGTPVPITQGINAEIGEFTYDPAAVTPTSPVGGAEVTVPTLRWSAARDAAGYRVTITPIDGGSTVSPTTTSATSFTPRSTLKPGSYRWTVQTVSEDGRLGTSLLVSAQPTFEVLEPPAPTATSPHPTSAETSTTRFPTLTWDPVTEATKYVVRLRKAGATAWNGTTITTTNPATEDVGDGYLAPGRYEFQVEAYRSTVFLGEGRIGAFRITELDEVGGQRAALVGTELADAATSCTKTAPASCQNLRQSPVLAWDSVPGAAYYKLYVSRDAEMTNLVDLTYPRIVYSTVWAPTAAFADSNAGSAYYWQVVPCSAATGCAPLKAARHQFNLLSNAVALVSPDDEAVLSDDITLDWSDYLKAPAPSTSGSSDLPNVSRTEASYYRVQTSTSAQFLSTTLLDNVLVDQTTFTSPSTTYPEGTVYWRVQAVDGSQNNLSWSRTGRFDKRSPVPEQVSPGDGGTLDESQVLTWEPLPFAASYNLEVYRNDDTVPSQGNRVLALNTKQTSHAPVNPLPAAASSYRWRVQRVDAKGRVGAWSRLAPFVVVGTGPGLQSPADGTRQDPNGALFAWGAVKRASTYRFERRATGSTSTIETRTTAAQAWAPLTAVAAGSWEWRVVAVDPAGADLGSSAWRGFTVIDRPATVAPQITGAGQVGTALTSTLPSWNLPDVVTSYQWYRGTTAIPGATTRVYELTQTDLNQSIKVRVTGTRAGYPAGTADSNIVKGGLGTGPSLLRELVLQGTATVGTTVSGSATWQETGVTTAYQWLVGGVAVSGATTPSFVVRTADAGKTVQLRATGTRAGYSPTTVTSNALTATGNERLVATGAAKVSGIAKVGYRLTANPGTWTRSPSFTYQWLRDGVAVTGATSTSYLLGGADAGRLISVRVTAKRVGYLDGTSTSTGMRVAKAASRSTFTLADRTIRRTTYPRAYVTVTAPTGAAISGTVSVYDGTRRIKYVSIASSARGKVTITVPRLSRGTHYLSVGYGGNAQLTSSRSAKLSIKVS